jgi:RNA polymerase sporulation-specific sigma factor
VALEEIMLSLKPMVNRLARGYFLTNGDNADLIQEGMIGLYKAILNYKLDSEVNFVTYTSTCVRRQMISAVRVSLNKKNLPLSSYIGIGGQGGLIVENIDSQEGEDDEIEYTIPSEDLTPEERVMLIERNAELKKRIDEALSGFEKEINMIDNVLEKPLVEDSLFWLNQAAIKFTKTRFNGDIVHK